MNSEQALLQRIRQIWEAARYQAARSVNSAHVCANWLIGQQTVEAEQQGAERAEYGAKLLKLLSQQLATEYGSGFSVSALQYMRAFYLGYPELIETTLLPVGLNDAVALEGQIQHALRVISGPPSQVWQPGRLHNGLSWTHYRALLKVDRPEARSFYEIEAIKNGWSARQLERQINSLLFDRLLKSRDQAGVLALANEWLIANKPSDLIKDPYVLGFAGVAPSGRSAIGESVINAIASLSPGTGERLCLCRSPGAPDLGWRSFLRGSGFLSHQAEMLRHH